MRQSSRVGLAGSKPYLLHTEGGISLPYPKTTLPESLGRRAAHGNSIRRKRTSTFTRKRYRPRWTPWKRGTITYSVQRCISTQTTPPSGSSRRSHVPLPAKFAGSKNSNGTHSYCRTSQAGSIQPPLPSPATTCVLIYLPSFEGEGLTAVSDLHTLVCHASVGTPPPKPLDLFRLQVRQSLLSPLMVSDEGSWTEVCLADALLREKYFLEGCEPLNIRRSFRAGRMWNNNLIVVSVARQTEVIARSAPPETGG